MLLPLSLIIMTDHATCIEEIMKSYHILYISLTLFGALSRTEPHLGVDVSAIFSVNTVVFFNYFSFVYPFGE